MLHVYVVLTDSILHIQSTKLLSISVPDPLHMLRSMAQSKLEHRVYAFLLLLFVGFSLPAATLLLWFNYAAVVLAEQRTRFVSRKRLKSRPSTTVLITGASSAHGLNVAQAFYKDGHRVISAGIHRAAFLNIAKRSRAISKHYDIPYSSATQDSSYAARCLFIIAKQERADLWIDCSQDIDLAVITSAQRQIREGTSCICIAADDASLQFLRDRETLLRFLRDKQLPAPEVYSVRSRGEIHNVLNRSQGKKQFLLKSPEKPKPFNPRDMLPRRTLSQTYQEVSLLKITPGSQLLLEEYIDSSNTYQCSVVVVKGTVELFSAKQLTGDLNTNFSERSALWKALRAYTDSIAQELGPTFLSHLKLIYLLNEKVTNAGVEQQVLPIEGSLHLDPLFVFPCAKEPANGLVLAYMSALQYDTNGTSKSLSTLSNTTLAQQSMSNTARDITRQRYFLAEDVEKLAFHPAIQFLLRRTSLAQVAASILTLSQRLLFWDEAYYDFYDPFPAFWQYTVVLAWRSLTGA